MRIFHNYPTDRLVSEAERLEQIFERVSLTVEQARINRRVYAQVLDELSNRTDFVRTKENDSEPVTESTTG